MNLLEAREFCPVSDVALVGEQKETCGDQNHEPFGDKFLMHVALLNFERCSMRLLIGWASPGRCAQGVNCAIDSYAREPTRISTPCSQ